MKTAFSAVCIIGLTILLSSCKGDSDGSSGGRGDFPDVSYERYDDGDTHRVRCFNADNNVYEGAGNTSRCTWNCAYYAGRSNPTWVRLTFADALTCEATGVDAETGEVTQECSTDLALVNEEIKACVL